MKFKGLCIIWVVLLTLGVLEGIESLDSEVRIRRGVLSALKGAVKGSSSVDKNCSCPIVYQPVCGNDRVTYASACYFKCAFQKKPKLRVVHQGSCD